MEHFHHSERSTRHPVLVYRVFMHFSLETLSPSRPAAAVPLVPPLYGPLLEAQTEETGQVRPTVTSFQAAG